MQAIRMLENQARRIENYPELRNQILEHLEETEAQAETRAALATIEARHAESRDSGSAVLLLLACNGEGERIRRRSGTTAGARWMSAGEPATRLAQPRSRSCATFLRWRRAGSRYTGSWSRTPSPAEAVVRPGGRGIAIALRSARLAANVMLEGLSADSYIARLREELLPAMRRAGAIDGVLWRRPLRRLGLGLASLPGVLPVLVRLTRID